MSWLSERECLEKLGIETPCCTSCMEDVYDGVKICEAYTSQFSVSCCCEHADEIQLALDEDRLP